MSDANNLVDSKVSASGEAKSLAIEKFNGQVRMAYHNNPGMMQYFDMEQVTGTNVVSNKYLGTTTLQALAPGKDVRGSEVEFDKNSLVIDTTVIARNIVAILDDVQDDIQTKGKLAVEQVAAIRDLENRMLLQQGVYGAISNTEAKRTKPRVSGHGFSVVKKMLEDGSLSYPLKIAAAIEWVLEEQMDLYNVPLEGMTIFMPWPYFNALRDAERIVHADYSTYQQETLRGFAMKSFNVPVVPTNHFPRRSRDHKDIDGSDQAHHILSNANNAYRYDVKNAANGAADGEDQEKCAALIIGKEGLLVGRSIELTGEVWWNKGNKSWYIDTYIAEGAIPDRWEHLGAVMLASADEDGLQDRFVRKAQPVRTLPGSTMETTQDAAAFVAAVEAVLAAQQP